MASTTKIMTAIVALEKGNTKDIVKISGKAASVEGSSMYLKAGERISLGNLIYGLMLVSGNDAATAIAEHIAGDEEKFAKMMNAKAKEIGAENTHFTNPHGLSDDEHYTTAKDLAKITAYGLKNPVFAQIVKTVSKTVEREELGKTVLVNHNKLLKSYEGCIGVKTGFTKATGRCLVSATERDGVKLVCVTLNAGDDWNDHKKMCDGIFETYKATLYHRAGTVAKTVRVKNGRSESVGVLFKEDIRLTERQNKEWEIFMEIPDSVYAPVKKGEVMGRIVAVHKNGNKQIFDAVAEKDVFKKKTINTKNIIDYAEEIYINWISVFVNWDIM
jgi:D-alanyl-D-alanine carboxypeptidase